MNHQISAQHAGKQSCTFTRLSALCGAIALSFAGSVSADTVIDFNTLASPTFERYSSHTEDGFVITFENPEFDGEGFGVWGSEDAEYGGSPALSVLDRGSRVFLHRVGGGTFDLISIRLNEFQTDSSLPTTVQFWGGDGFTVDGLTTNGTFEWETFTPIGFKNQTFVSWVVGAEGDGPGQIQFDDITLAVAAAPVPLPAAAWGGMALMGLIGAKRLCRRRSGSDGGGDD